MTTVPAGACDCHAHVFGPYDRFPLAADRPYTPGEARLDDLRAMHEALGVERVVIVAASPYGTDNAAIVDALRRLDGAGRGVVALDPDALADADLAGMHAAASVLNPTLFALVFSLILGPVYAWLRRRFSTVLALSLVVVGLESASSRSSCCSTSPYGN